MKAHLDTEANFVLVRNAEESGWKGERSRESWKERNDEEKGL